MFTYSHANTPLGQSERAYCLSYFIKDDIKGFSFITLFFFSSFMLQVSMNDGTTFVSSDVNITAKNCTKSVYPTEPAYSRTTTELVNSTKQDTFVPGRSVSHILFLAVALERVWN